MAWLREAPNLRRKSLFLFKKHIMTDDFFTKYLCDRCNGPMPIRTMSWFNNDTICMHCKNKETELRKTLPEHGKSYEGCGYVPVIT